MSKSSFGGKPKNTPERAVPPADTASGPEDHLPRLPPEDIALYIADMSLGLVQVAAAYELRYLSYLLSIVETEARARAEKQSSQDEAG